MQRPGVAAGRSVIAHNEDGAPENVGQCAMLTLAFDGLPTVTAFWYPGFLPSNAFAVTGDGLVWTIDHLPVASPGEARAAISWAVACSDRRERSTRPSTTCGRTLRRAGSLTPSATGPAGSSAQEAAAGRLAVVEVGPGSGPLLWHTNHGRYLPGSEPSPAGNSVARGETLGAPRRPRGRSRPRLVPARPGGRAATGRRPLRSRARPTRPPRCARSSRTSPQARPSSPPGTTSR